MEKTALITGGSGMVGSKLLSELSRRKNSRYKIKMFDIDSPRNRKFYRRYEGKFEWVKGDLRNPEDVEMAVRGVDAVVHLAALIPPSADHFPELAEEINVGGTRNLVEAMERHAPKAFLVYSSSVSYYGDRLADPWIKVGDPYNPSLGDHYATTKKNAEDCIVNSGLSWTIFRLSAIFSPDMKPDPLMFHMPLDTKIEFTTARDTGFAFAEALDHRDQLNGQIFNLGGGEKCRVTYRDFLQKSFRRMGLGDDLLPEKAFAEQNFHCGYYQDGHLLNDILHFQRDTKEDYLARIARKTGGMKIALATLARPLVRWYLIRGSEPLQALRKKDSSLIRRFYKSLPEG